MKRILTVLLALALAGYLGCGANAAEIVKQGTERLAVMGSADYATTYGDNVSQGTSLRATAEYGYMILDQLELALRGTLSLMETKQSFGVGGHGDIRRQDYAAEFVPKWRPAIEGNISPFVGPKVGVRYVTDSIIGNGPTGTAHDTVFDWGAVLGADIFLGKNVSLVVEYDYTQFTMRSPISNSLGLPISQLGASYWQLYVGNITVRDHALSVGLAYWW